MCVRVSSLFNMCTELQVVLNVNVQLFMNMTYINVTLMFNCILIVYIQLDK